MSDDDKLSRVYQDMWSSFPTGGLAQDLDFVSEGTNQEWSALSQVLLYVVVYCRKCTTGLQQMVSLSSQVTSRNLTIKLPRDKAILMVHHFICICRVGVRSANPTNTTSPSHIQSRLADDFIICFLSLASFPISRHPFQGN